MRYCNFGVSPVNYSDSELACLATQIYRLQFRIKTQKANQKGPKHDCIAYIPILDIVETTQLEISIILSNNICDVHGYAGSVLQTFA